MPYSENTYQNLLEVGVSGPVRYSWVRHTVVGYIIFVKFKLDYNVCGGEWLSVCTDRLLKFALDFFRRRYPVNGVKSTKVYKYTRKWPNPTGMSGLVSGSGCCGWGWQRRCMSRIPWLQAAAGIRKIWGQAAWGWENQGKLCTWARGEKFYNSKF